MYRESGSKDGHDLRDWFRAEHQTSSTKATVFATTIDPAERSEGELMRCSVCRDLERALESKNVACVKVLSGPYCHFSDRFMTYGKIELECAKTDLKRRRSVFVSAIREGLPAVSARLVATNRLRPLMGRLQADYRRPDIDHVICP